MTVTARDLPRRLISPAKQLLIVYTMPRVTGLFQIVIELPEAIETSGVDFNAVPGFREMVEKTFRAAIVHQAEAFYRATHQKRDLRLDANGDEGDDKTIVAVFGIGARPKALIG